MTSRRVNTHLRATIALGAPLLAAVLASTAAAKPNTNPNKHFAVEEFHLVPSTDQAAAHEDLTTSFDFAHTAQGETVDDVRTVVVNLPAGFIGNNTAVPTCSDAQLLAGDPNRPLTPACPPASVVGRISFKVGGQPDAVPLYNMEVTSPGVAAVLGFHVFQVATTMPVTVRPGDEGLTITSPDIVGLGEPREISVTVWGLPAAESHDAERLLVCEGGNGCVNGPVPAAIPVKPFLSNPTSCGPFTAHLAADSWEHPGALLPDGSPDLTDPNWSQASAEVGPIVECERVPFDPSIEVDPTTRSAESSSGLDVSLIVPQSWENPDSIATANLKDSVVTLPVGYTANPSLASGLGVCTPAQFESETSSSAFGSGCPPESKIGEVDVETPVLQEKHLTGNIYIAKPYENKFGTLLGLYIVVKDPARGIIVKLAGKIEPNETTGQLVTTFDNSPQVPFSKFTLKLRQGANSPLVSPPACGSYAAEASLTPWSAPLSPQRVLSPAFNIETGIGGGPCPAGGVPPFHPGIVAGTLNNRAGAYSPLDIRITRNDGEQEITRFSSQFPPGLTANLTGIPFCPDASIEAAKHVSGAQEEAAPSCPASSEIGHTLVGAGVGSVLAWTPGKVYLAGPYNGAPFSIAAITSAKVGPFDLGTVVVREALKIDPTTAAVTVDAKASDPIPHIIKGIVIHARDIRVYIDRPHFMINPTNCNPLNLTGTIQSDEGTSFPVTVPFQTTNCATLKFKPVFKVSTSGKTSRANGASLHVKLSYPNAPFGTQANIKSVHVELPKALPSRLSTLNHACLDSVFNQDPASCPSQSKVGVAKAVTPVLPVPLEGPAYFVSHGGQRFPELIVVLQGYGVTVYLQGETFISKAGITSSTFKSVPDVPVGSFELTLPEGAFSALAANTDLCAANLAMPTTFTGQNGAVLKQRTSIEVQGCPYALRIVHRAVKKRTLTLKVSVPQGGKLVATGKGLTRAAKSIKGRSTLTLTLKERRAGKLRTKVLLRFTPAKGKQRKVLRKSITVSFR